MDIGSGVMCAVMARCAARPVFIEVLPGWVQTHNLFERRETAPFQAILRCPMGRSCVVGHSARSSKQGVQLWESVIRPHLRMIRTEAKWRSSIVGHSTECHTDMVVDRWTRRDAASGRAARSGGAVPAPWPLETCHPALCALTISGEVLSMSGARA